jgi:hypothetical protein
VRSWPTRTAARQLNPQLIALADWLVQHKGDIPLN